VVYCRSDHNHSNIAIDMFCFFTGVSKMTSDHKISTRKITIPFRLLSGLIQTTLLLIRERYRSISLRFKIAFFVVILLTCTFFGLSIITVQIMNGHLQNEIIKRGESVGKSIAASAGYSLLSKDLLSLDNLVFKAKSSNRDMEYVAIVTPKNKIIVHSEISMSGKILPVTEGRLIRKSQDGTTVKEVTGSSDSIFEISCPIVFMKRPMGRVMLAINKSVLLQAQGEVRARIFLAFGIILVLGTIASVLLASFIIKPIKELSVGVNELKQGISKSPLKIYSDDELGKLIINFNEMSSTIAQQQSKLNKYARDLEEAYVSIVRVVAAAIDAKDPYTQGHSARVSQLSLLIGEAIGLSTEELKDLEVACLLHDVGKITIPDSILLKPGRLNRPEYDEMAHHVESGADILDKAPSLRKYIPAVRHHHERQDGKGYPDGLSGDDIPLFAAIIAIADTFDAMTTKRPYKKAIMSEEKALQELVRVAGKKLRADLVAVFVGLINKRRAENVVSPFARAV
jgi:HD-GYP domain-containing protein (c-di-GMP phosphodiesterase class II)